MATRLASACRCTDFVGCFGRDEFVLLLPETSAEGATVVARKLLLAASATPCRAAGSVTLSLGVLVKVETVSASDALSSARESLHLAQQQASVSVAEHGNPLTGLLHT
ncbi:GGDEF domain-containing protein [Azohydromonas aeria]|uniref:GGDEF domain-containing protein n=1 Tax=Azohydromonas aeria TaxID=2590212 RepID=UPI001E5A8B27|nr:diguanylate cyclase [Azohydromonas aeria]